MSEFTARLDTDEPIKKVIAEGAEAYRLGALHNVSVIEVGFEDVNVKAETDNGIFLFKLFSAKRDEAEVDRNVSILNAVRDSAIHHPRLQLAGEIIDFTTTAGIRMVAMDYVEGKTFYDMKRIPTEQELGKIAAEAVKINNLDCQPQFLFDGWAIPNMRPMFEKVKDDLTGEGRMLVAEAFARYESIPLSELPTCFVHGDLTKANIVLGDDGEAYVVDFSVANVYPRIQELAVMSCNLMFDETGGKDLAFKDRVKSVVDAYRKAGGKLTDIEKQNVFNYALPGAAMEYMGSVNERVYAGDDSEETKYWEELGLQGLREAI